jgi:hypothetical protein
MKNKERRAKGDGGRTRKNEKQKERGGGEHRKDIKNPNRKNYGKELKKMEEEPKESVK